MSEPWLPNFIIAGMPKSGTSSLFTWIADHPDVLGSTQKETYFFVDPGTHMHDPAFHIDNGLQSYRAQFPLPPGSRPKVILEATPSYAYSARALDRIPDLPSRPKCLFLLREPAAQIYSLYSYFRDNWNWIPASMSFSAFVDAVREGGHDFRGNELAANALDHARYVEWLEPWRQRLGPDRMKVLLFEDLARDPAGVTVSVAEWLGLDPGFYRAYGFPRENETYRPRNRALQSVNIAVRHYLPKGRAYRAARSLYRNLNTKRPKGADAEDQERLEALRRDFRDPNSRLAERYGLDLSTWEVQPPRERDTFPRTA